MDIKEKIIEGAFRLFLKHGFSAVSTNEVIREEGVTKGCFYHYFKNKEDLISQVLEKYVYPYLQSSIKAIGQYLEQPEDSYTIGEAIHFWYTFEPTLFLGEEKVSFREMQFLIYEGIKKYNALAKESSRCSQKQRELVQFLLEKGQKRRCISPHILPETYATTMIALKDGLIALHILDGSIDVKEKCEATFEVLWKEVEEKAHSKGGYFYAETAL